MAKQTVLEEVKARMQTLKAKKAADLEEIRRKQTAARTDREAAEMAMRQAAEVMNVDQYETAKAAKTRAETALDMYAARFDQIQKQEYVSEEDSDSTIKSLLTYEDQLTAEFKAAAAKHVKALAELRKTYTDELADTEWTLTAWQQDIHRNYLSYNGAMHPDGNGGYTNRSQTPVPVRVMPFTGCTEASKLGEYLNKCGLLGD